MRKLLTAVVSGAVVGGAATMYLTRREDVPMVEPGSIGKLNTGKPETWPGPWSRSMSAVDSELRPKFYALITELEKRGYLKDTHYTIGQTWRSLERQQWIVNQGWSRTLNSRHVRRDKDGNPASRAVDFWPVREKLPTRDNKAAFYHALWLAAELNGLVSGASWSQSTSEYKEYGLGWDPGHVQG